MGSPSPPLLARRRQKGLEQSAMVVVTVEEKFRVPLNAEKEPLGRRFNGLDDAVRGQGAGDQDGATSLTD